MYDDYGRATARVGASYAATLVGFPISCLILTLLTDLAYWATASFMWETASVWLLTVGLVGAAFTVLAALIDLGRGYGRRGVGVPWLRVVGYLVAAVVALLDVFIHSRDGYTAVIPEGVSLTLVALVVVLLAAVLGRTGPARRNVGGLA